MIVEIIFMHSAEAARFECEYHFVHETCLKLQRQDGTIIAFPLRNIHRFSYVHQYHLGTRRGKGKP